jgi:hypothetical protein
MTDILQPRLVDERASSVALRQTWLRSGFPVTVFRISIPVAFVDPRNAQLVWILLISQHWGLAHIGGRDAAPSPPGPGQAGDLEPGSA